MGAGRRFGWAAALLLATVGAAAPPPKPPRDAPTCAPPGTAPLFVAPMGEPFRAAAGRPYPSGAWFAAADRDGDGAVDAAEFDADARRFFRMLDRDGDGLLAPDEVGRYEAVVAPEIALYAARRADPGRRGRAAVAVGAGRYAWLPIPEPVAAADADLDRQVGEAEFLAAARARFRLLDPGGTGRLRPALMPRTTQQQAIEGPCRPPKARRGAPADGWDDPQEGQPR